MMYRSPVEEREVEKTKARLEKGRKQRKGTVCRCMWSPKPKEVSDSMGCFLDSIISLSSPFALNRCEDVSYAGN